MSFVPVLAVAVVYAGTTWIEGWKIRREARRRLQSRRETRPWLDAGWEETWFTPNARRLETAIERAVLDADIAWSRLERVERAKVEGESPFQIRRARAERSVKQAFATLERVRGAAMHWLEEEHAPTPLLDPEHERGHRKRRRAVAALVDALAHRTAPPASGGAELLDLIVDVLENALGCLRTGKSHPTSDHPFRRA